MYARMEEHDLIFVNPRFKAYMLKSLKNTFSKVYCIATVT